MTQDMNKNLTKNCTQCGNLFPKDNRVSMRVWLTSTKYCSRDCMNAYWTGRPGRKLGKTGQVAWNKGIPQTEEAKKKCSDTMKVVSKELGFGKWMTGKKQSVETRQKKSDAAKAVIARGEHNWYIDGRTPANKLIRHSLNYKLWREAVFARDNWTCVECKERGCYLEAHHIKPFAFFPELRFAIDNGVSVCTPCHAKVDVYRRRTLSKTK